MKPNDIAARIDGGRVELVAVARCNSRRVLSYLIPGRRKPISGADGEFVSIRDYQAGAKSLYETGERLFATEVEARRAILQAATNLGGKNESL